MVRCQIAKFYFLEHNQIPKARLKDLDESIEFVSYEPSQLFAQKSQQSNDSVEFIDEVITIDDSAPEIKQLSTNPINLDSLVESDSIVLNDPHQLNFGEPAESTRYDLKNDIDNSVLPSEYFENSKRHESEQKELADSTPSDECCKKKDQQTEQDILNNSVLPDEYFEQRKNQESDSSDAFEDSIDCVIEQIDNQTYTLGRDQSNIATLSGSARQEETFYDISSGILSYVIDTN